MPTSKRTPTVKRHVLLLLGVYRPANHAGIARYAREAGWSLDNLYAQGGRVPIWWNGDGMITLVSSPRDYAAFRSLPRVPAVDLSKGWISNVMTPAQRRTGRGRPRVLYDNVAIGRLAAEHFLERGFRHIAFFNLGNFWMEAERLPSFRQAVRAAGAECHEIPYHRHFSMVRPSRVAEERAAFRWLVKTIGDLPKPLGMFVASDDVGLTILRACDQAGVSVPEDVAVLGCENEPLIGSLAPVPLSSVDTDLEQQGYVAAQLLDRLMHGEPPPRQPIVIPPKGVVTRQSTNTLAVPHLPVSQALRFIWEHFHEPIQTPDIAAAAGMSRRGLEQAFRQHLNRTIGAELARCRIEHAKNLLATSSLKARQVAERCGFSDAAYFSHVFRRAVGTGPQGFRRRRAAT